MLTEKRKNLIYLITYIGYASIYISRINLSMAGPDLKAAGILTTAQLGFLGTAFSVVYALGRLFNSMRADGVEPRTMIGTGLLFTGLAGIGVGMLPPYGGILLLWCVNAFAQSMLWSSVLRIVHALYDGSDRQISRLSFVASTVASGQVAGILLALFLLGRLGLRWAFLLPGLFTLLAGVTVFLTFPLINNAAAGKTDGGAENTALPQSGNPFRKLKQMFGFEEVRLAAAPSVFMGLMKDNVTLWMAVYFVDTYGIDLSGTTGYVLFIPLVGLAARLLFPAVLKLFGNNEHKVSRYSFAGSAAASLVLLLVKDPLASVIALSLVYAFMSLTNSSFLSVFPVRFAKEGCIASITGVMDFTAYIGAGIGSAVFGLLIGAFGYGAMFAVWLFASAAGYLILRKLCTYKKE